MRMLYVIFVLGLVTASGSAIAADFSDEELIKLGEAYARSVNDLDAASLKALVSDRHLSDRAAAVAGDNADERQQYADGLIGAMPTVIDRLVADMERQGAVARFQRIQEFQGMRGPLVRLNVGDGFNFMLLIPVRPTRTSDSTAIGDIYVATSGELLSESIGVAMKLVSAPSATFLGKLFGNIEVDDDLIMRLQKVGELRQQNRLQEAYDVLDKTPGDARNHRLIITNITLLASQFDDRLYRKELRRLARHHKDDPRVAFVLLDHYFYEEDYDAVLATVDLMETAFGRDAVLFIFRTSAELQRGRLDAALSHANVAAELEPDSEDPRWAQLNVLVARNDFKESVQVITGLESDFGYAFVREDFEQDAMYEALLQSPEFEQWLASR